MTDKQLIETLWNINQPKNNLNVDVNVDVNENADED